MYPVPAGLRGREDPNRLGARLRRHVGVRGSEPPLRRPVRDPVASCRSRGDRLGALLRSLPDRLDPARGSCSRSAPSHARTAIWAASPATSSRWPRSCLTVVPVVAYFALLLADESERSAVRATIFGRSRSGTGRGPSSLAAGMPGRPRDCDRRGGLRRVSRTPPPTARAGSSTDTSRLLLDARVRRRRRGVHLGARDDRHAEHPRSLLDRLFGTAVLDALEATAPRPGPWGALDAFDTSHRSLLGRAHRKLPAQMPSPADPKARRT